MDGGTTQASNEEHAHNQLKRKIEEVHTDLTHAAVAVHTDDATPPPCKEPKIDHAQLTPHTNMSAASHAEPEGDCTFCCEDFTTDNYVEYQSVENGPWLKSQYCRDCIEEHFIGKQWGKYLENIAKADCAAALRRVLSAPPQINVKDPGLPCTDNGHNDEVYQFWYAVDNASHSARLVGSLIGAERDAFWAEKQAFLTATELQEEITKADAAKQKEADK